MSRRSPAQRASAQRWNARRDPPSQQSKIMEPFVIDSKTDGVPDRSWWTEAKDRDSFSTLAKQAERRMRDSRIGRSKYPITEMEG